MLIPCIFVAEVYDKSPEETVVHENCPDSTKFQDKTLAPTLLVLRETGH